MSNSGPSPRQTLSYLRELFAAHGIRPKNKLGQNFLIDLNLLDLIVRTAELSRADLVLEVGTGTGGLTARLAREAGAVLSVEIDEDFFSLANEVLAGQEHVTILHTDVLENKNKLCPEVLSTLAELRRRYSSQNLKMVANLPYAVATPVIANFLLLDLRFERMVVMVQAEIAERLLAMPGTKEYGALAVLIQSLADVEAVRRHVPPVVFWPRPQVASAIMLIRPNAAKRARVGDVGRFRLFLRDLYTHRRKNLRGALAALPNSRHAKTEIDSLLNQLGVSGTARAEDLNAEQHLRLCEVFG
ncbi:MAG TPA: 16S rRNA (adenine(1518)-N(6)/adenine(1519)-N(6))-dimethyltransferase RsmA [Gemmataceae bacterium]|nr:16S rRNA (adenine(1518)-N(6)/adenine(1519)-N(6))-dimethyltransferase RsmA [Gemmataceae bacterium]